MCKGISGMAQLTEGGVSMERLTYIDHLGWYANGHGGERMRGSHIDRLAAYEDTGIDPDELRIIGDIKRFKYEIIFGSKADRLKELSDADNAGRLIVLPCKVGTLIYIGSRPAIITQFFGYVRERYFHAVFCDENEGIDIPFEEIGKAVFLTREEAEAALAEKEGSNE